MGCRGNQYASAAKARGRNGRSRRLRTAGSGSIQTAGRAHSDRPAAGWCGGRNHLDGHHVLSLQYSSRVAARSHVRTISIMRSKSEHVSEACRACQTLDHPTDKPDGPQLLPCGVYTRYIRELHACYSRVLSQPAKPRQRLRHASNTCLILGADATTFGHMSDSSDHPDGTSPRHAICGVGAHGTAAHDFGRHPRFGQHARIPAEHPGNRRCRWSDVDVLGGSSIAHAGAQGLLTP